MKSLWIKLQLTHIVSHILAINKCYVKNNIQKIGWNYGDYKWEIIYLLN
jgi:hypothetical protein